jgi:hypothetical protein
MQPGLLALQRFTDISTEQTSLGVLVIGFHAKSASAPHHNPLPASCGIGFARVELVIAGDSEATIGCCSWVG